MEDARAACCGKRPDKTRGTTVKEMSELFPLVKELPRDATGWILRYECRACGQVWEQHQLPFMHADVDVVVKEGIVAELGDPPVFATPTPEPPEFRDRRVERRIFLASSIGGAVIGLATRPPAPEGARARGDYFAFWLIGGVAVGFVLLLLRQFWKEKFRP